MFQEEHVALDKLKMWRDTLGKKVLTGREKQEGTIVKAAEEKG